MPANCEFRVETHVLWVCVCVCVIKNAICVCVSVCFRPACNIRYESAALRFTKLAEVFCSANKTVK